MIYRVGDNEITTYDNKSLKTTAKSGSQEKFSLEQYSEGQIPEDKEKDKDEKKDAQKTGKSMPVRTESGGVKLELSAAGISGKGGGNRAQRSAESESGKAFLESVRQLWEKFITFLKGIFEKIWNDPPAEAAVVSEESDTAGTSQPQEGETEPEPLSAEALEKEQQEKEAKIRECLASHDMNRMVSLLTEDGNKTLARNSTLLTYYDKTGKIADVNVSDRERILHGDRNVRKL